MPSWLKKCTSMRAKFYLKTETSGGAKYKLIASAVLTSELKIGETVWLPRKSGSYRVASVGRNFSDVGIESAVIIVFKTKK